MNDIFVENRIEILCYVVNFAFLISVILKLAEIKTGFTSVKVAKYIKNSVLVGNEPSPLSFDIP